MSYLALELRFTLATPFHSTGNRWTWLADKALALSATTDDPVPVIPATSWKGILRSRAEAALRSLEVDVCESPQPAMMCAGSVLCVVCRTFGNPRKPSPLRFADAVPVTKDVPIAMRSGVSLSRYRRAALPGRLFGVEVAGGGRATWWGTAHGDFSTPAEALEVASIVLLGARACHALGAGSSRGLGWLAEAAMTAMLDGQPVQEEDLRARWRLWLEERL
jgi:hypothetical protein